MSTQSDVLYADKRFTVTTADIKTPSHYYPISETVGRIRKDIQFACLGIILCLILALAIYNDLWYFHEKAIMAVAMLIASLFGWSFSIMQIDARGFPSRLFIIPRRKIAPIFGAISKARAQRSATDATRYLELEQ